MKKWWWLALAVLLAWYVLHDREQVRPAGVLAANVPAQGAARAKPFNLNGYQLHPLASFQLTARVLSREDYRSGREADLSPVDIAFGWGPMSDSAVLQHISISQGNRWYHWQASGDVPITLREIEVHSANMHLIPANRAVEKTILSLRKGQLVTLQGHLVRVEAADGWHWNSSLTREDTGNGACEVIHVESLAVQP